MITRITAVYIENFKRIAQVNFNPDEFGITIIGGNNRQGKTSILDAIMWGLGGAKFAPTSPNNLNGHGDAEIRIELSNGISVERKGKNGSIKVTDPTGKKAGQELLNEVVSVMALNLPRFMEAGDREKAFILLDTLGIKDQLDELDDREKVLYDERTEVGRVALSLKKHADELPFYHDAPDAEISAATVIEKQRVAVERNNQNDRIRRENKELSERVASYERELAAFDEETPKLEKEWHQAVEDTIRKYDNAFTDASRKIEYLKAEIEKLEQERSSIATQKVEAINEISRKNKQLRDERSIKRESGMKTIEEKKKLLAESDKMAGNLPENVDLSIFQRDIENLELANAKFRANQAHDKAAAESKAQEAEYAGYTEKVESVRRERMKLLSSVKMPLAGLAIKDGLIYYNGQKWDCMSGSERLIVGTSIVRAVNPACGFVLMDKLEQMDLNSLEMFDEWLKAENLQVIATRVSTGNECSIVIEDGKISVAE